MNFTKPSSVQLAKLKKIRHLALDMDGTLYSGKTLFDFTADALEIVQDMGVNYSYLTNNSSRSVADYLAKVRGLGLKAEEGQIYTSSLAAIEYIKDKYRSGLKIFVLGTESLRQEFRSRGFTLTTEFDNAEPDIVVAGYDTELTYLRLCKAAYWVSLGKAYIATHPDKTCPTDEELVLVDCGAVCRCIEEATGRKPDLVLGKPDPCMIRGLLKKHDLKPDEIAMVGDRLYTDMAMAVQTGALGILVLSGETQAADLEDLDDRIMVFDNIHDFAVALGGSKMESSQSTIMMK